MQLWNLLSQNIPVARVGITIVQDVAPIHQLQSTLTLPQPRSLPVPRSQSQMKQDKSPRSHSSHKHGRSPSPSAKSDGHKQKEAHTEDTCKLNSTLPISSSRFDGFHSLTGYHSEGTELHPPSITFTPLGLGSPRQWRSTSKESRCSLVLLNTSPGFNLPGQPVAGPGNLMPSIPSLAGSHHMSSTWPTGVFTSGLPSPHLTIDQANSLYKLATECQVLSVKLAKKFQVLSGLEAMHHNSIQGTVYETLTLGCSAQEAAHFAIIQERVPDDECKATIHCLCSEADAAWKEMHEVMYNHQLQYDDQLANFFADAKKALSDMRGKAWDAICTLVENESITFNACLGLALQVLNLFPQIPIDILFHSNG